ncbi:MAG: hypothetical protein KC414_08505, partial [Romboutsia sp.]|nr:hypothetical protein [Romboutsia sp.]
MHSKNIFVDKVNDFNDKIQSEASFISKFIDILTTLLMFSEIRDKFPNSSERELSSKMQFFSECIFTSLIIPFTIGNCRIFFISETIPLIRKVKINNKGWKPYNKLG